MRFFTLAVLTCAVMHVPLSFGQNAAGTDGVTVAVVHVFMPDGSPLRRRLQFTVTSSNGQSSLCDTDSLGLATLTVLPNSGPNYTIVFETDNQTYGMTTVRFTFVGAVMDLPVFLNPPRPLRPARSGPTVVSVMELQKPPEEARSLHEQGLRAFAAGDKNGAIGQLQHAVSLCPTYTAALNDLGIVFLRTGNLAGAEEVLTRAAKISPGSEDARLNLGIVWTREHKYGDAIETLERLRLKDPENARVLIALADALVGQGRLDEAAPRLLEALKSGDLTAASQGAIHYKQGMILSGKQLYPAAVKELSKAVKLIPNSPLAHLELGIAAFKAGQWKTAERELSTAYQIGGSEAAGAQILLGEIYRSQKKYEAARSAFAKFLAECPNAPQAAEVRAILESIR